MTVPRILLVTHAYPRCIGDAPGSFVHRLVRGVQSLGAEVSVLAPNAPGLAESEVCEGVLV
ncbi:MAG: glycosyltransferase family 4 protein, partial [Gemmatimonadota bacterium]